MVLFHDKPPQIALICGQYVFSGQCTEVVGGTMTAGSTSASNNSALLTWSPAMVSAPILIATVQSGGSTTTGVVARFTGVGVSNAYIHLAGGASPVSGVTVGIMIVGEAKL